MVIGNGLMAKAFSQYLDDRSCIIFASGVSNSVETDQDEFNREKELVVKTLNEFPNKLFVYFSTCSVYDEAVKSRPYVLHKERVEELIKNTATKYLIFRVTNVVGATGNSNTIMNFLVNAVSNNIVFELWEHAERNFIDQEDLKNIVNKFINSGVVNETINVGFISNVKVKEVVHTIEEHVHKTGDYTLVNKGNNLNLDLQRVSDYFFKLGLKNDDELKYIKGLLKKYY